MPDLSDIKAKIRALRAKTVERGCTEAEAEAAAAKALDLMQRYGIDAATIDTPDWAEADEPTQGRAGPQDQVYPVIAAVTRCALCFTKGPAGRQVRYLGRDPWPTVAAYLHQVCHGAMERALREYRQSATYRRMRSSQRKADARRAFLEAMALRLGQLLIDYADRSGLGLDAGPVLAAKEELARRYNLTTYAEPKRASRAGHLDRHRQAGWSAGGAVKINPGTMGARAPAGLLTED